MGARLSDGHSMKYKNYDFRKVVFVRSLGTSEKSRDLLSKRLARKTLVRFLTYELLPIYLNTHNRLNIKIEIV